MCPANKYMVINSSPPVPIQTHTVFKPRVPNGAPNKLKSQSNKCEKLRISKIKRNIIRTGLRFGKNAKIDQYQNCINGLVQISKNMSMV